MPSWGAHKLFADDEIRDMAAYLKTLDTPAAFGDPLDDPARRSRDEPERDNLDPFDNPGMATLEEGERLFHAQGPADKSCTSCHDDPGEAFATWDRHPDRVI